MLIFSSIQAPSWRTIRILILIWETVWRGAEHGRFVLAPLGQKGRERWASEALSLGAAGRGHAGGEGGA